MPASRFLRRSLSILISLAVVGALAPAADESAAPRQIAAEPLGAGETLLLDGRFDEPVWARARPVGGFLQREPHEGAAASQSTEVRVAFDRERLYVAATLLESEPQGIRDNKRHRDADFATDDVFVVLVDPFSDGQTGYVFATNPAGALRDAILRSEEPNWSWNGLWDVRVSRDAAGWRVEMAIPFHALNFDPARPGWTINFRRVIRRLGEEDLWSGYRRAEGFWRPAYGGILTGLTGLSQGLGLQVQPYGIVRRQSLAGRSAKFDADAGLDLTYSLSTNLRAAVTVNTDFADTEVDQRRVNLGRFPLFFPEKRGFFLEGSSVFGFPGRDSLTPFYSRRIGLREEGPVPVLWGARLAGQAGDFDVGVLQLSTRANFGYDAEQFSVARLQYRFNADERIGGLVTRRAGEAADAGETVALDGQIKVFDRGEGRKALLTPFAIWTSPERGAPARGFFETSYVGLQFTAEGSDSHLFSALNQVGPSYAPALGFAFDSGFRSFYTYANRNLRPKRWNLRAVMQELEVEYRANWTGGLRDGFFWLTPASFEFESGRYVGFGGCTWGERVGDAFEIHSGIVVPAARYSGGMGKIWFGTGDQRPWGAKGEVQLADFFGGTKRAFELTGSARPAPGLEFAATAEFNQIVLPAGRFSTRVLRARGSYSFTTRHAVHVLVQTDDVSDTLGLQARFRWTLRPGADVFVGYLRDWQEELNSGRRRWTKLGEESAIKAGYTWVF